MLVASVARVRMRCFVAVGLAVLSCWSLACRRDSWDNRNALAQSSSGDTGVTATQPESPGERLGREVREKLVGDPELAGSGSITVLVDGSRVILEGWVGSVNELTTAEADAATVAGVSTVDNRLLVRPPQRQQQ
jgi:osmotically-inducible protein OsmY